MHEGEEGHARPGWTTSRRGQDSLWKSQSEWQRTGINGEKVRPWCSQPSDRGRLKNRTELLTGGRGGEERKGKERGQAKPPPQKKNLASNCPEWFYILVRHTDADIRGVNTYVCKPWLSWVWYNTWETWSSTSCCEQLSIFASTFWTVPSTSMIDSFVMLFVTHNITHSCIGWDREVSCCTVKGYRQ